MSTLSYRASLKNPAVEEPIDLLVHRPLGYLVARAAYATPVTADMLTVVSMLLGIASGVAIGSGLFTSTAHPILGALLLIASAVFDCSDGQLARMRGSSSRWGRMLDGSVDTVVQVATVPTAVLAMIHARGGFSSPGTPLWIALAVGAALTGMRHTTLYDHFKNVYVRNTEPSPKDCDDLEDIVADEARARAQGPLSWTAQFGFAMYRTHLALVAQTMRWIDPYIPSRFRAMPSYSPERASRYRALNDGLMRAWSFFGVGTHIFTFALCVGLDRVEWYIALRLFVFNGALLVIAPLQRKASRAFFAGATRVSDAGEQVVA